MAGVRIMKQFNREQMLVFLIIGGVILAILLFRAAGG
jgi:hypothetical protein